MTKAEYEKIGKTILDCAFEVHKQLGAGLLESAYEECLLYELHTHGLKAYNQHYLPLVYKGVELKKAYYIDILVEDAIVIELKAVEKLLPIHEVQLSTYMKLGGYKLGYLINFNELLLKNGIKRWVNDFYFDENI